MLGVKSAVDCYLLDAGLWILGASCWMMVLVYLVYLVDFVGFVGLVRMLDDGVWCLGFSLVLPVEFTKFML